MQPIGIRTTIPAAGTKPSDPSLIGVFHVTSANMLEVTGTAVTGVSLYLLRWHPDIGVGGQWRPWKSDRPFVADANGFFSGDIEIPRAGSEYFLMFSLGGGDTGEVTDCYITAATYR